MPCLILFVFVKVPLLRVMKGSYFGACKVKKHFHCLIICIYFDLICSMTPKLFAQWFIFPNPSFAWRWSAVIGRLVSFSFLLPVMSNKAVLVSSAALCTALPWKQLFAPKAAPSGKEWICIFIQTNEKRPTSGRAIWNSLGLDSFQWFRVDSFFWETITLYTVHFQI